jgi:hypothetical protein
MTTPRPSRRRSLARASAWCGVALAAILTVAWVGSSWREVTVLTPYRLSSLGVWAGRVTVSFGPTDLEGDGHWGVRTSPVPAVFMQFKGFHHVTLRSGTEAVMFPLWPFILALAIPSTWILLATRRPRDPLACPHCRYPRGVGRGASPICPECGQPLPNLPPPH